MSNDSAATTRTANERCMEICHSCISYLNDRFVFEKGLFRSPASLTDVRLLQTQMMYQGGASRVRNESDPHIVTGVLQKTLKELSPSPLFEVYEDILSTEISEDSVHSRILVQNWLVKLPQDRFELVRTLFALLQRIATVGGNDSNAMQLAYYIAPYLCRRENSAYMSIRHMEDLRKIRPVVAFLVENHPDVFTDKLKPQFQRRIFVPPCDSSSRSSTYSSVTSLQCNEGVYNLQLPSYRADGSAPTMNSLANHTIASSNAIDINKLRKNLSQLITSPSGNNQPYSPGHGHGQIDGDSHYYHTNGSLDSSSNEVDPDGYGGNNNIHSMYATSFNIEDSPQSPPSGVVNTSAWEWKIFKSLLQARVGAFMAGDGTDLSTDARMMPDRMKKHSQYQGQGTGTGTGAGAGTTSGSGGGNGSAGRAGGDSPGTGNGSGSGGGGGGIGGASDHKGRSDSMSDSSSPNTKERRRKNLPPVLQINTTPSAMVCDTDGGENGRSRVTGGKGALSDYLRDRVDIKGGIPDFGDAFTKSTTVLREKGTRRARVSQCKNLRGFIMGFENDWLLKRGVAVKDVERGDMQIFYTRYKEMKRVIRDDAAIDIQRCARGFVVRSRISRFSGMIFNSSESPGAKSRRGSGSKDMRKGSNSVPKYQLTHATSFSNTLADHFGSDAHESMDTEDNYALENKSSSQYKAVSNITSGTGGGGGSGTGGGLMNLTLGGTLEISHTLCGLPSNTRPYKDSKIGGDESNTSRQRIGHDGMYNSSHPPPEFLPGTIIPYEIYRKYRTLLEEKRNLKRELKQYDEDFSKSNGRLPKKSDKECMRPSYQKYHEVRGELDVLQSSIEKKYGLIPLFTEEALDADKSGALNSNSTSSKAGGEGGTGARSVRTGDASNPLTVTPYLAPSPAEFLSVGAPNRGQGAGQGQGLSGLGTGEGGTGAGATSSAGTGQRSIRTGDNLNPLVVTPYLAPSPAEFLSVGALNRGQGAGQGQGGVGGGAGGGGGTGELFSSCLFKGTGASPQSNGPVPPIGRIEVEQDLKKLQAEITDLHMFLKTYERDFNLQHSRPVMSYDDIQPVATEYIRYKELKSGLKSKKGNSGKPL